MIKHNRSAFTLAEMMIVMLILTILLAAFAPLMTRKAKVDLSSPWRWAANNTDIYYGMGTNQSAMIGQNAKESNDSGKFIIKNNGTVPHIQFKGEDNARLLIAPNSVVLTSYGSNEYSSSTAVGINTLINNKTSDRSNTGFINTSTIGFTSNWAGMDNSAFGFAALKENTKGMANSAFGGEALSSNTTGYWNSAFGHRSMLFNTKGTMNVAVGKDALSYNSESSGNTAIGFQAAYSNGGIEDDGKGEYNTAIGIFSLYSNTGGDNNVAVGNASMYSNTTGENNVAVGLWALKNNKAGNDNVAIGNEALASANGTVNHYSFKATKCYVQYQSQKIGGGISGTSTSREETPTSSNQYCLSPTMTFKDISGNVIDSNQIIGSVRFRDSKYDNRSVYQEIIPESSNEGSGDFNKVVSIGSNSCKNLGTGSSNVICLGTESGPYLQPDGAATNKMYLGNETIDTIYLAGDTHVSGTKGFYIGGKAGDGAVRAITTNVDWKTYSDKRFKENIVESKSGLNDIKKLKVYNFNFKNDKEKTPHVGVIAQELQKIFPNAVTKDEKGYLTIRKEDMFYAAINAIKELDKMLQDVVAQVKTVVAQVTEHDKQIKTLQKENKELKSKVQNLEKQVKSFEKRLNAIEKKL